MAMASWMIRGRTLRSGRSIRSRHDSEDEVQLDFSKDANENAREILSYICKKQGLSEGKRFSYLNVLVKLVTKSDVWAGGLGYSIEELQCCLRVALVNEASQVRAAALRAVRYLLKEEKDVRILNKLRYPCLISRSLDLMLRNDAERVQALRLVRRMLVLAPMDFPISLARSLVSLANGAAEEKDRMLRSCLATLAEICVLNSEAFILCGGVTAVMRNLLDCQMPRIAESLCGILLFLLNNPATRSKAGISLQSLAAPYCDFHLNIDRNRDEREIQFHCSRLALLSVLRSWPGLLHFCHPANSSGLRSLVNVLYLKQLEVRKGVLDLLYELLGLPQPEWTDEFSVALDAVDPSHPRDTWKLQEGFVSAEGRDILPHLARFRPNIVEIHLALLLYTFLHAGLLEAIVEVIVTSDTFISVRATILLGELLHLIHNLLPPECCNLTPALPNLLSHASNASVPSVQHQALSAVAILSHLHTMLKRRPAPASLFLDRTLQAGGWGREESKAGKRSKVYTLVVPKEGDDLLKDSAVLTHKDGFSWNWNVVRAVLKSRSEPLKKLEDSNHRTFLKRLVHYFKPSSNRFSRVELGNKKQTQMYTLAGLELIDCLLEVEEAEGGKLLNELLADIWVQIDAITSSKSAHDCLFSPQHMSNSVCQDYFMFIGRLCRCSKGLRVLDKAGIFQQLLHLVVSTNHDCYVKLVVSGLDYSMDGMPRVILSKVLTAPAESFRLYATQFLLVLLRARLTDFQKWGIELLVMQLYDQSKAVSLAAIAILGEATEEKIFLDAVISLRPSLLHLGDKGLLLLIRFLSTANGFTFLQDANFVTTQLDRWASNYNYRYVRLVEGDIHDSLTLHQCGEDGRYSRRVTNTKHYVRDVFIPPHLYGQLVQHEKGFQLLVKEGKLHNLFQCVHSGHCSSEQDILELKAALWGCGHVATSPSGISLLAEQGIVHAVLHLAQTCPVYSVRGTAFYVLGLMATTFEGANLLSKAGWLCVRHHRHDRWPVITEDEDEDEPPSETELLQQSGLYVEGDSISFSSQVATGWESNCSSATKQRSYTVGSSQDSNAGRFYIPCDDDDDEDDVDIGSTRSGDDEGFHLEERMSSTQWIDLPESNVNATIEQQRKSRTLPHPRHHSVPAAPFPHRHSRSLSECKQTNVQALPAATVVQTRDWALGPTRKDSSRGEQESKSRCNSCTDSSGVSSCDSGGLGPTGKHGGPHEQTLSPIPSSTSLNTLKSGAVAEEAKGSQISYRKLSSIHGSITSGHTSPDTSSCRLSQQDMLGYATLRYLHRYHRPLYSDTVSLAAMELLVLDEHGHSPSSSRSSSASRALKVHSLDRHYAHPGMCEFEASLPPQLLSGASSISLAPRTYIGSRSNLAAARHSGFVTESSSTQQCYMGICLPRELAYLYPREEPTTKPAEQKDRGQRGDSERRRSTSVGEMEDLQEAGEEDIETSCSSDSEDLESQMKTYHSAAAASDYRHSSTNCLACCRLRDRKISASSYHRYRTDTESSYGGGESPILMPRRRKSHSASCCLLGLTPGGSVESGNSTSLDIGSCHQRESEEAGTPSKALIRHEILKHVMRMSNPVWIKLSKQTLLQLKQQYPAVFQDVCLYSEVSHRMGSATYRLTARRFLQELFLDLQFDALYEEPAAILQSQQSVMEGTNGGAITSTQNNGHSPASSSTSPSMQNVSSNQDIVGGHSLQSLAQPQGIRMTVEQPASPTGNIPEVTAGSNPCQEGVISNGEKPSISENATSKSGLNTKTVSLDTVAPGKVLVPHGVYTVRSPPLEVVKEESSALVSHLGALSVSSAAESGLVPDQFPVGSAMKQLVSVSNPTIVSARNEVLISAAEDVNHIFDDSLPYSFPTQWTTHTENAHSSSSTESMMSHTLTSNIKKVPFPVVTTEQSPQVDSEESICSLIHSQHKKTNSEQSVVSTPKAQEEAEDCVALPNVGKNVCSYDLLVTESKSQESGNLNLPTQDRYTFCQNSSDSAVSVTPLVSSVVPHSAINRSGWKAPELQNKRHESYSATHVQRSTLNCVSQTTLCPNTPSTTVISIPKSKSVLKDSSDLLPPNSYKPETCTRATESAFSPVKAVFVHEVSLPEPSVLCQMQTLMPSHSEALSASEGVTSVNTNNHTGASSTLDSNATTSQNKQTIHRIVNEDLTSSLEIFSENQSSTVTVNNFPEMKSTSLTDVMGTCDPECRDTKSQVPAKTVVIGTRQRKLATACPPNISSLTKTVTKTVPASADSKKVQCSDSSCKSGSSNLTRGESVKIKSKIKK